MKRYCLLFLLGLIIWLQCPAQSPIRIFDGKFDPPKNPNYDRLFVKPPDWNTFGNQTQFITLRDLSGDYIKKLDDYTIKYDLGNIIWPSYSLLFQKNVDSVIQELKRRNLYLFDLWGFVPGSGPGGYWQAFNPPKDVLSNFNKILGDHWLGMDNGEQDGRYIGSFAKQLFPTGKSRQQQYLNFQNHFEALGNQLGNKMATLVSLNFGHYFLKEGIYTLIGAETAQALPNAQVYYSFIRGAAKQYGVPWFGNVSVYNRWGYKSYTVSPSGSSGQDQGGPTKGTSLSLMKRLLYSQIFYNSMMVGFESGFLNGNKLGSIGRIQRDANEWLKKFGQPGNMITQVGLMLDFYSGWSFPRHLYSGEIYKVWGNLPYKEGDYLTNNLLDMFYPGYQNSSYYHDENGFNVHTPYGDAVDCLFSDAPLWLLKQYPVLVIADNIAAGYELKDKLEAYVEAGGCLIVTGGMLQKFEKGLCGVGTAGSEMISAGQVVNVSGKEINEKQTFKIEELVFPQHATILAQTGQKALAVRTVYGKGEFIALASEWGQPTDPSGLPIKSEIDKDLPNPYPLLTHVKSVLDSIFRSQSLFTVGDDLSYIVDRKSDGLYNLLVCNNNWSEKPLKIEFNGGKITDITESRLTDAELKEPGYFPEGYEKSKTGKNSTASIAGGSVRIFTVKVKENIELIPEEKVVSINNSNYLRLSDEEAIKQQILMRPTFFQHYSGALIDWKYLYRRDIKSLAEEAGWISRQKLNLIVDFTSGLNLFPDLRLVNNDSIAYSTSMTVIREVMDKAEILGVKDIVLSPHRTIENNFTNEKFYDSFITSVGKLTHYARQKGMDVHLRVSTFKSLPEAQLQKLFREEKDRNLYLAPGLPWLSSERNFSLLSKPEFVGKVKIIFLSSVCQDMFGQLISENDPLFKGENRQMIEKLQSQYPDLKWVFDANYTSADEEYLDVKYYNTSKTNR